MNKNIFSDFKVFKQHVAPAASPPDAAGAVVAGAPRVSPPAVVFPPSPPPSPVPPPVTGE